MTNQQQTTRRFDAKLYAAALAYYGLPEHYRRTFSLSNDINPKTGLPYLVYRQPDLAAQDGKASWVQLNQPGSKHQSKKADNQDIEILSNISLDFEYPANPFALRIVAADLVNKLVELKLAEPGLAIEDSGAGNHIVVPVVPFDVASAGGGSLVNEAVRHIVRTNIEPEFQKLLEREGLAGPLQDNIGKDGKPKPIKLEAFDISRILSAPGTWRPAGSKPNEAKELAGGYLRRWLYPFDQEPPTRNESQNLTDLIKATAIMLAADKEAEAKAKTDRANGTSSQGISQQDPAGWLRGYADKKILTGDRSTDFHSFVTACYLKFDKETALDQASFIDELTGDKYGTRAGREAERSLHNPPLKTDRVDWYSSRGYQYPPEYEAVPAGSDTPPRQDQEPPKEPPATGRPVKNEEPLSLHNLTDLGNTHRLIERFGQDLRYVFEWGWNNWDGRRWKQDKTGAAKRIAKKTVATIYTEAGQIEDSKLRIATGDHAKKSESSGRLEAMLSMAETELEVVATPDQFDRDPWLLTCMNGTLDLRTGELRPHNREDLITKLVPVEFRPEAQCPEFLKFLDTVLDKKQNLIRFLQKAVGYSLTGQTNEQALFLLWGTGRNGKSTLLTILGDLLGDYAQPSDFKTFLERNSDGPRNDIAKLAGARLVTAAEADPGRKLAESVVKQLTGGDVITARFLNKEFFEFSPTFKIFLAANHKPQIRGQDLGIWRRIMLLPFLVTIPESSVDKHLEAKLKKELPGIFAWAVQGCRAWQQEGLNPPDEVREATKAYQSESDILRDFLIECCTMGRNKKVELGECYKAYTRWSEEEQEHPLGKRNFIDAMTQRGYHMAEGHARKRFFYGIELTTPGPVKSTNRYENPESFDDMVNEGI